MTQLIQYYELIKKDFAGLNWLKTCKELYEVSRYRVQISNCLKELGYICPPEMESTLFFALVDIILVVDSDGSFYYATLSKEKLIELRKSGRFLPQKGEVDYHKAGSLVEANTLSKINEYLSQGKFHFIKLNNIDESSFYCNISGMNPYPKLTNERVYSIDFISDFYWKVSSTLLKGMYKVNDIVCTTSPSLTQGRQLNKCPMSCKLNVKTFEGMLEDIYVWDIHSIDIFVEINRLKPLYQGVCKVGNSYVTLNREILERYYGSTYLNFESQGVRERYCLEELFDINRTADIRYYINKYKLYKDEAICSCRNIHELQNLLRSRVKPTKHDSKHISVRVLTSPSVLWKKHKSYYQTISIDSDLEVVENIDSIMPQVYKVGGVTNFGYCIVEVTATSFILAEKYGKDEFIRQFGNLYKDKVLGVQRGSEALDKKHRVFNVSLETQRRICEMLRWGYVKHYEEYARYIRGITDTLNLTYIVSDDMIKILLINPIAKESGRCNNVTLEILGSNLERFLNVLVNSTEDAIYSLLEQERSNLRKRK